MSTHGIHHITAISSNPQKTLDFYTQILGLRFVKKTVNFDSPDTYHFYFGNEIGEPGTVLTFFPFPEAGTGMRGLGQVTKIYFAVNKGSLGFWLERFIIKGIKHDGIRNRFNENFITFFDPDGLQLEIVGTEDPLTIKPWITKDIPTEHGIAGFFGAELAVEAIDSIAPLLTEIMGYEVVAQEDLLVRYQNKSAASAKYLDLLVMKGWPEGISSAGTNHHIAFRVKDREAQLEILKLLRENNFQTTEIVERYYFTSVYFREKNNILFEIATDGPGFTIDENINALGSNLKLPPQYEPIRGEIESILTEVFTENSLHNSSTSNLDLFSYRFIDNNTERTTILFHGTGGDEISMIKFAKELNLETNILSIRGNVPENGMNRYFARFADSSFDNDSLQTELSKLHKFIEELLKKYKLHNQPLDFLGYSNGANFALAFAFSYSIPIDRIFALHPVAPSLEIKSVLADTEIVVTYGEKDNYSTDLEIKKLSEMLDRMNIKFNIYKFDGGHAIEDKEIEFLRKALLDI